MRSSYFLCKNPSSEATSTKVKKALQYSAFTCRKSNPLLNFTFTLGHQFNTKHNISNFFPFFLFFLLPYTCFNKLLRVLQQLVLSSNQATPIQGLNKNMSDQSRSIGSLLRGATRFAKMITGTAEGMQTSRSNRHEKNITQKMDVIKHNAKLCRQRILQATKKLKK